MKAIHVFATAGALGLLAMFSTAAAAQPSHGHDHTAMSDHMGMSMSSAPQVAASEGQVRKIDAQNGKVTLMHEASKELGMPAMTMVYGVSDPAMLSKIKVGDRVHFSAATAGGKMTITEMQATH